MTMRTRLARLFTVKTRLEAFLLIYAIAVGAAERARHYIETYPGASGYILAAACSGVVFIAGGMLLDHVKARAAMATEPVAARTPQRRQRLSRSRPRLRPMSRAAASRRSLRTD